jgi:hypothetical protein
MIYAQARAGILAFLRRHTDLGSVDATVDIFDQQDLTAGYIRRELVSRTVVSLERAVTTVGGGDPFKGRDGGGGSSCGDGGDGGGGGGRMNVPRRLVGPGGRRPGTIRAMPASWVPPAQRKPIEKPTEAVKETPSTNSGGEKEKLSVADDGKKERLSVGDVKSSAAADVKENSSYGDMKSSAGYMKESAANMKENLAAQSSPAKDAGTNPTIFISTIPTPSPHAQNRTDQPPLPLPRHTTLTPPLLLPRTPAPRTTKSAPPSPTPSPTHPPSTPTTKRMSWYASFPRLSLDRLRWSRLVSESPLMRQKEGSSGGDVMEMLDTVKEEHGEGLKNNDGMEIKQVNNDNGGSEQVEYGTVEQDVVVKVEKGEVESEEEEFHEAPHHPVKEQDQMDTDQTDTPTTDQPDPSPLEDQTNLKEHHYNEEIVVEPSPTLTEESYKTALDGVKRLSTLQSEPNSSNTVNVL